ncbi:MAG: porin family protein [Gammaproteobacteria bacterium]|nr:porin family protein [Gammaproteobacteria bacterium]
MSRIWLVAGVIFAVAAAEARADENEGLYLGAGLGDFSTEIDSVEDVDIDFDEDSDATRFFAGWRFNPFLALQLDYLDFGDSRANFAGLEVRADSTGIAPSIVGTLPLGPVELFARGGMLFYDVEIDADGASFIDESGEDLVYSAGVGLTVLERLALRAEYEIIEIDEFDDAEAVWLTAAWRF